MNILLIRPRPHKDTIGLQSVMICEPLELMQLSSVLKQNGHVVNIIDMIIEKKPVDYFVKKFNPDVLGITGYISHVGVIKDYAKKIKLCSKDIKVLVGGVHAKVCPEDFIDENIDYVCRSADDFYDFSRCKVRKNILPDREITKKYQNMYYYLFQRKCALIKTSFGCPYNCNFCFCKEISSYSARQIDDVIREIKTISQEEIYIVDDDFLFNRKRLLEFYQKLKENDIHKHYLVYGRADFISKNEDIIEKLKEVGLSAVIVGIEASSQEELDSYNKNVQIDDNVEAIRILRKHNIECYATVILGIDWGKSDFKRLYNFIKKNRLVFVNLQPFTPMPRTPYFDEYKNKLIIPYDEHEKWDMAHLVVKPGKLSIRAYYYQIISLYYKITMSPKNIIYMIKRYSLKTVMMLSCGALAITWQYIKKIIKG
ncbi:UNVERIFIED_CONTAM: radical SAM superfamily enzyme YgiQ (UPF0313 family) [Acetivibrio alkalicellulosi]